MDSDSLVIDFGEEGQLQPHKPHNGKSIDHMIVSLDINYIVTYSKDDNSISGWLVDIEKNKQYDMYFALNKSDKSYKISSFVLYKKILVFYYNQPKEPNNYRK